MAKYSRRDYLIRLAIGLIGTPYVWGGNFPFEGLDCSGFVNFVYKTFGLLPPGDRTANDIYDYFRANSRASTFIMYADNIHYSVLAPGDLAFYGPTNRISHIAVYMGEKDNVPMIIGANGGGSSTTSFEKAKAIDARVKIAPLHYRKDLLAIIGVDFNADI